MKVKRQDRIYKRIDELSRVPVQHVDTYQTMRHQPQGLIAIELTASPDSLSADIFIQQLYIISKEPSLTSIVTTNNLLNV